MGIQGLLPLFKSIQRPVHIKDYAGQTVAIDGYVWLHKGAFACAWDLAQNKPTTKFVDYCVHRLRMLIFNGVKPLVVFDGGALPSKLHTEKERKEKRKECLAKAKALCHKGKRKEATEYFQKGIDVTPQMAYQLIQVLRAENIEYYVAPYEADAQLAYLEKIGRVSAIITEDSDLLVFGCKRVIFKLDQYGNGVEIRREDMNSTQHINLNGWTQDMLRHMCILSGCDYLPSIPGMGIKKAHKYINRYKTADRALKALRLENQMKIPPDYEQGFQRAELTFLYQRVYDPETAALSTLNPVPEDLDISMMEFLGPFLEPSIAKSIAEGITCPIIKLPLASIKFLQDDVGDYLNEKENVVQTQYAPSIVPTSDRKTSKITTIQKLSKSTVTNNKPTKTIMSFFAKATSSTKNSTSHGTQKVTSESSQPPSNLFLPMATAHVTPFVEKRSSESVRLDTNIKRQRTDEDICGLDTFPSDSTSSLHRQPHTVSRFFNFFRRPVPVSLSTESSTTISSFSTFEKARPTAESLFTSQPSLTKSDSYVGTSQEDMPCTPEDTDVYTGGNWGMNSDQAESKSVNCEYISGEDEMERESKENLRLVAMSLRKRFSRSDGKQLEVEDQTDPGTSNLKPKPDHPKSLPYSEAKPKSAPHSHAPLFRSRPVGLGKPKERKSFDSTTSEGKPSLGTLLEHFRFDSK
ncbi:uncharacterized protein VTP21DRAFT_677 [Calcarisporiella thermophila]|uniref:uncharacterized protein n=1 Tax=Calcarisporiella thermophila TaxID=911321 RepID=UPI0037423204